MKNLSFYKDYCNIWLFCPLLLPFLKLWFHVLCLHHISHYFKFVLWLSFSVLKINNFIMKTLLFGFILGRQIKSSLNSYFVFTFLSVNRNISPWNILCWNSFFCFNMIKYIFMLYSSNDNVISVDIILVYYMCFLNFI